MTRAIFRLAVVAVGAAIAVWLLPASVHIVNWPSSGPVRVALLAPARTLGICLAAAVVFLAGVACAGAVLGPRVPQRIAAAMDPFALLWLWAVPYLPWLPDRAPLLLALAGPLRWGVACLALVGAGWLLGSLLPASSIERDAATTLKDKAEPLIDTAKQAAQDVADNLQEPAKQAITELKSSASDSVVTVKDEVQQGANQLASSAQSAADEVRGQ